MGSNARSSLVLGLTLAVLAGLTAKLLMSDETPAPIRGQGDEVTRALYYRLTDQRGPTFRLQGAEHRLKVVSHAVIERRPFSDLSSDSAPADLHTNYGITLSIENADGEPFWSEVVYIESRRSVGSRGADGAPPTDSAYVLDARYQLTDDRIFFVDIPRPIPDDARLVLRAHDAPGDVLARVYALREGTPAEQTLRALSLGEDERVALARTIGVARWEHLEEVERAGLVRERWLRLSARGVNGIGYELRPVYYTGWRAPPPELADDLSSIVVSATEPCAVNLVGPTTAAVTASIVDRGAAPTDDVLFDLKVTGSSGVQADRSLLIGKAARVLSTSIAIPEGAHSLLFSTRGSERVKLSINAPLGGQVRPPEDDVSAAAETRAEPDRRRIPLRLIGPTTTPATFPVLDREDRITRTYRLDLRALRGPDDPPEAAPIITVEGLSDAGEQVFRAQHTILSERALFESVERLDGRAQSVDEVVPLRFIVPTTTTRVRVTSTGLVGARLYAYAPSQRELQAPYNDLEPETMRWRYAPLLRTPWVDMRFDGRVDAKERDELASLIAQVRLEPRDGSFISADDRADDRADPRPALELHPQGSPRRQLIIAPVPEQSTRSVWRAWPPATHTALQLHRDYAFDFSRGPGRRPTLHYWTDPDDDAAFGAPITVRVDDVEYTYIVSAGQGTWRLPRELSGAHDLRVEGTQSELRLLLDRPESGRPRLPIVRARSVYRAGRRALVVRVRKPSKDAVTVNAILYAATPEEDTEVSIVATIDGGAPKRIEGDFIGSITSERRTLTLPAASQTDAARFADRTGAGALYPRTIPIRLGDDIPPGTHTVALWVERGSPLWARFFVFDQERPANERSVSWGERSAPAGKPE